MVAVASTCLATGLASPASAQVDNTSPVTSGCYRDAITARRARPYSSYYRDYLDGAWIELRYSPRCRTAWVRILGGEGEIPGDRPATFGNVIRSYPRLVLRCVVPRNQTTCYSNMVNDKGTTSRAYGEWSGPGTLWTNLTGAY